jgi:hypothetical protein
VADDRPLLALIIPTRNRASLAIEAARSLLRSPDPRVAVWVSDNSTDAAELAALQAFCAGSTDPRLAYIRPPQPVAMPDHWEWALNTVMEQSGAFALGIHYDRRVTRPEHLQRLLETIAEHPGEVITYAFDQVVADVSGDAVTLWQPPWEGTAARIRTARLTELTARGDIDALGSAFPVLSNCSVPVAVLRAVRERFGTICESAGLDSCFTFRFCALYDAYLHLDVPLGVLHASHRSVGLGYLRGAGGDFAEFMAAWDGRPWIDRAPIPGLNLGHNLLFSEYETVRAETGARLPPLQLAGYLGNLYRGLRWVVDPDARRDLLALLEQRAQDWEVDFAQVTAAPPRAPLASYVRRLTPRGIAAALSWRLGRRFVHARPRITALLHRWLGYRPSGTAGARFAEDALAVEHALTFPRRPTRTNVLLASMRPEPVPRRTPHV